MINLFEGIKIHDNFPSFIELICRRVSLSKTAIQDRIRVGKYLIENGSFSNLTLLYRKNGVSHSKILQEIRKIDKKTSLK